MRDDEEIAEIVELQREAKRLREHDDAEAELEHLIDTFAGPVSDDWPVDVPRRDAAPQGDEFVCLACHLSLHRNLRSGEGLCVTCARALPQREEVPA